MNMTHYMELLAVNQPWNLLIFMAGPVVLAETLAITEFYLLFTRNFTGWVHRVNRSAGIIVGIYFVGIIGYLMANAVLPITQAGEWRMANGRRRDRRGLLFDRRFTAYLHSAPRVRVGQCCCDFGQKAQDTCDLRRLVLGLWSHRHGDRHAGSDPVWLPCGPVARYARHDTQKLKKYCFIEAPRSTS